MPPEIRHSTVTDPQVLRALSHPLRLRLIEEIAIAGSATATELAETVGESPANCSWHLRQLAKSGFIEPAPGGAGRQRPWRVVVEVRTWGDGDTAEMALAGDAAAAMLMEHEYQALRAYQTWRSRESAEWRSAAGSLQSVGWCTADELDEVRDQIFALLSPFLARVADPAARPADARLVRFVNWGIPMRPIEETGHADA